MIKSGEKEYHFVEFMACPGGCIGGGGQPIPTNSEILLKRMQAIYEVDRSLPIRKSHENPAIKILYEEF
ncbi:iron hydrogenase small subunit, partial [Petrotoga sp. 8T1HF07.NaAc.6.1]